MFIDSAKAVVVPLMAYRDSSLIQQAKAWKNAQLLNSVIELAPQTYQDSWRVVKQWGKFWRELGISTLKSNLKSGFLFDGGISAVRNAWALYKKQEKPARAVGNVAADITLGTVKGIVGSLAVTGTTMGLTALGLVAVPSLLGIPILVANIAASWLAYRLVNKYLQKHDLHRKLSDTISKAIDKDA
ncbi:MAG: hypothetical protein HY692_05760 [Cyanobacteria bacterium NC_groundwater_1444_Ag_S-0.65um_54_12]|nr:hypothetical protein [Cyanobacteria bacterium NC_groundwater_1444_Ag_S-0.65um_54_12]